MVKTAAVTTRSPLSVVGADVLVEDARAAEEQLNWSHSFRPTTHVCAATGPSGWVAGSVGLLYWRFRTTADGEVRVWVGTVNVHPDTVSVVVGARCQLGGTDDCNVRFVVGASGATISNFTTAHNGTERTATITTAATGTGVLTVEIHVQRTVGTGGSPHVRNVRIQDAVVAAATSIPDPPDT